MIDDTTTSEGLGAPLLKNQIVGNPLPSAASALQQAVKDSYARLGEALEWRVKTQCNFMLEFKMYLHQLEDHDDHFLRLLALEALMGEFFLAAPDGKIAVIKKLLRIPLFNRLLINEVQLDHVTLSNIILANEGYETSEKLFLIHSLLYDNRFKQMREIAKDHNSEIELLESQDGGNDEASVTFKVPLSRFDLTAFTGILEGKRLETTSTLLTQALFKVILSFLGSYLWLTAFDRSISEISEDLWAFVPLILSSFSAIALCGMKICHPELDRENDQHLMSLKSAVNQSIPHKFLAKELRQRLSLLGEIIAARQQFIKSKIATIDAAICQPYPELTVPVSSLGISVFLDDVSNVFIALSKDAPRALFLSATASLITSICVLSNNLLQSYENDNHEGFILQKTGNAIVDVNLYFFVELLGQVLGTQSDPYSILASSALNLVFISLLTSGLLWRYKSQKATTASTLVSNVVAHFPEIYFMYSAAVCLCYKVLPQCENVPLVGGLIEFLLEEAEEYEGKAESIIHVIFLAKVYLAMSCFFIGHKAIPSMAEVSFEASMVALFNTLSHLYLGVYWGMNRISNVVYPPDKTLLQQLCCMTGRNKSPADLLITMNFLTKLIQPMLSSVVSLSSELLLLIQILGHLFCDGMLNPYCKGAYEVGVGTAGFVTGTAARLSVFASEVQPIDYCCRSQVSKGGLNEQIDAGIVGAQHATNESSMSPGKQRGVGSIQQRS